MGLLSVALLGFVGGRASMQHPQTGSLADCYLRLTTVSQGEAHEEFLSEIRCDSCGVVTSCSLYTIAMVYCASQRSPKVRRRREALCKSRCDCVHVAW